MSQPDPGCTLDVADGVAVVTMSDAKKRNALSTAVVAGLKDCLGAAFDDPAVRAIVLTGANGVFCAGGDISGFDDPDRPLRRGMLDLQRLCRRIANSEKPTVAAVEGGAFGGGLSLALLCDQIVAAENSRFCSSFARIGLVPDLGLLATLPARVGVGRAKEMMMLAEDVPAADALADGMVDDVVPAGTAVARAKEIAAEFAAMAPLSLAYTKATMMRWPMTLQQELTWESQGQGLLFASEDLQEGRAAFFEKRKPAFTGK